MSFSLHHTHATLLLIDRRRIGHVHIRFSTRRHRRPVRLVERPEQHSAERLWVGALLYKVGLQLALDGPHLVPGQRRLHLGHRGYSDLQLRVHVGKQQGQYILIPILQPRLLTDGPGNAIDDCGLVVDKIEFVVVVGVVGRHGVFGGVGVVGVVGAVSVGVVSVVGAVSVVGMGMVSVGRRATW
jgi:hypothetical protein